MIATFFRNFAITFVLTTCPVATLGQVQDDIQTPNQASQESYKQGLRHLSGEAALQDFSLAGSAFLQAAEQNHHAAQNQLGRLYYEGLGVPKNTQTALYWLEKAIASKDAQHLFDLAKILDIENISKPRAASLYQQAMDQGHTEAPVNLALLYQEGQGVPQDYVKARSLYEPAAKAGNGNALNNLGLLYVRGHGVGQDYTFASTLFAAASEMGIQSAMANLGVLYANGFGVPLDEQKAEELFKLAGRGVVPVAGEISRFVYDPRLNTLVKTESNILAISKASTAGDPIAQFQLGWLLTDKPAPTFKEFQQAARLFKLSAEAGYPPAMANLGSMYFRGEGLPQDYVLGYMWLTLATVGGFDAATPLKSQFLKKISADQINEAQKLTRTRLP
ncbi:MAG: TPR repeat protein [Candidatus Azotimanducaceae bacterium]|jgi:TPR repeat protein